MRKITVIIGHPRPGSFNHALASAYVASAQASGADVRVIDLATTDFNLSTADVDELQVAGPDDLNRLCPAIAAMARDVLWADHLVFVHPVWWGTYPAVLKGFIDRVFISGVVFKYRARGQAWDRLLKGKTARLVYTMDSPGWFNRLKYRRVSEQSLRNPLLWYCGVKTIGATSMSPVRGSTPEKRDRWLVIAQELGQRDA